MGRPPWLGKKLGNAMSSTWPFLTASAPSLEGAPYAAACRAFFWANCKVLSEAPSSFSRKSKLPLSSTMQMVTCTFISWAFASEAATMVLMAARFKYFRLGRSLPYMVISGSSITANRLNIRRSPRGLVGRRSHRLPLQNDQELLNLTPLAFDSNCLQLFNLIMQLKFLFGFFRRSDPIIGHTQPIMRLAKLWVHCDCLGIETNRLFKLVLGGGKYPKLKVGVAAFRIDGYGLGEQGFHLPQSRLIYRLLLPLPDGHGVKVVGERVCRLLLHKACQSRLN